MVKVYSPKHFSKYSSYKVATFIFNQCKLVYSSDGSNHDEIMSIHIKKMKEGIERLQEITQKFNCTETYKEDVEYLIRNVKKAISRAETKSKQSDCK